MLGDPAAVQEHHVVGQAAGLSGVVGDEDDAGAAAPRRGDDVLDREHRGGVEAGGRLVEEQHLGVGGQRAGQRQALLLAAREQAGGLVGLVGEADAVEERVRRRARVLAAGLQHEVEVGGDRAAQQDRLLEHQRLPSAWRGRRRCRPSRSRPALGRHEAVEQLQQQALARAVRPHDHGAAAGIEREVEPVEQRRLAAPEGQAADFQRQERRGGGGRRRDRGGEREVRHRRHT